MTLFIVGFLTGGVVIGTLVAALFLSAGAQTDRERREWEYFQACVRAECEDMPTSEADSSGGGGDDG